MHAFRDTPMPSSTTQHACSCTEMKQLGPTAGQGCSQMLLMLQKQRAFRINHVTSHFLLLEKNNSSVSSSCSLSYQIIYQPPPPSKLHTRSSTPEVLLLSLTHTHLLQTLLWHRRICRSRNQQLTSVVILSYLTSRHISCT